jgi:hypothetical protein
VLVAFAAQIATIADRLRAAAGRFEGVASSVVKG